MGITAAICSKNTKRVVRIVSLSNVDDLVLNYNRDTESAIIVEADHGVVSNHREWLVDENEVLCKDGNWINPDLSFSAKPEPIGLILKLVKKINILRMINKLPPIKENEFIKE